MTEYEEIMQGIEVEAASCPTCGGDAAELGGLGRLTWYRCVCCGMEFPMDESFTRENDEH